MSQQNDPHIDLDAPGSPANWFFGAGAGNFWGHWGVTSGILNIQKLFLALEK